MRMLLVQGAKAAILCSKPRDERVWLWAKQLAQRSGWQKAAVALAAKNARILWAMFTRDEDFKPHAWKQPPPLVQQPFHQHDGNDERSIEQVRPAADKLDGCWVANERRDPN